MKKTTKLKILIITSSFLLIIVIGCILFNCFIQQSQYHFDSDTGFYNGRYLTYNNGVLTVKDPNYEYVDTYELGENKKIRTDIPIQEIYHNYVKYGTKIAYVNSVTKRVSRDIEMSGFKINSFICIYDTMDETNNVVFDDCQRVVFCKDSIAYTDEKQNIYLYCVESGETEILSNKTVGEIVEISTMNDYLYIFRLLDRVNSYITVFDIKTKNMVADFKIDEDFENHIVKPNNKEIIVHGIKDYKNLKFYDFSGNKTTNSIGDSNYFASELSVYNGDNNCYSVRNKETATFYDRTLFDPNNGLYVTDIKAGVTTRLSGDCEFEELIATENYIYCYTINHIISQGIIKDTPITGYTLRQIPINK